MPEVMGIMKTFIKTNIFKVILSITLFLISAFISILPAKVYECIINDGFIKKNLNVVLMSCALLIGIYIMRALFSYLSNSYLINIGKEIVAVIKEAIYERLFMLDMCFYGDKETGYIHARVEEVSKIDTIFSNMSLTFLASLLECLFAFYMISTMSTKFLIILIIPVPFLMFASYKASKVVAEKLYKTLESNADYSGKINETLRGMENIKSMGLEGDEKRKISDYNKKSLENIKSQELYVNKFTSGMNTIGSIFSVFIYLIGGILIIHDNLSFGSFIAISMYAGKLYSPFFGYVGAYTALAPALVALKRISDLFFYSSPTESVKEKYSDLSEIKTIEFKDVSISYKNKEILNGFSFKINKGDKIQLVGKNGSGKSSLIKIILKVIYPSKGKVYINNIAHELIEKEAILKHISYVPQKPFIFNMSVVENITYGVKSYSEEKLSQLLDGLGLSKIIEKLEKSEDNKVGENGFKLSGGEIQKIAIARALLNDREIVIFDEATNNLDRESIEFVKGYIKKTNKTWLIVDHQNDFTDLGFKVVKI